MKYLKVFEEFSDFYKKIRNDDIEYKKIIDIDFGIENMIESRMKHKSTFSYSIYKPYMGSKIMGSQRKLKIETNIIVTPGSPDKMVKPLIKKNATMIVEMEDEWFIVSNQIKFDGGGSWATPKSLDIELYECDQREGLIELLKKLDIIK